MIETPTSHAAAGLRPWARARGVARLLQTFRRWRRRSATRRRLGELDRDGLMDVGITEAARRRECAKWFWQ